MSKIKASILNTVKDIVGQPEHYYRYKMAMPLIEHNKNAKFLDCGCGDGIFTIDVANKIGTNNVYGTEIIEEEIEKARSNDIEVNYGDLNVELPYDDNMFDVVLANQVIEHLYNTDIFVKELFRVCKPGGYVIVATVNLASTLNILYLLFGKQPPATHVSDEVVVGSPFINTKNGKIIQGQSHIRVFTMPALKGLLQYHGFKIEKWKYAGYYPLPKAITGIFLSQIDGILPILQLKRGKMRLILSDRNPLTTQLHLTSIKERFERLEYEKNKLS